MGKKIQSEMKKQHELFIKGCVQNGLTDKKAEELFELIAPFAGYGFNKSHAACYAIIAFRTAYLKANFPVEFMTALLTAESRGTTGPVKNEKVSRAIAECKRLGIEVLPPDINKSQSDFSIEDKIKVRFGLSAVKNVGEAAIESILTARHSAPFTTLTDFCSRVNLSTVNKKTFESLIKAGAMDRFGNRAAILVRFPDIVNQSIQLKKHASLGQASLFDDDSAYSGIAAENLASVEIDDFTLTEKLSFEKEFLGFYLTSHPHMKTLSSLKKYTTHELEMLEEEQEGTRLTIGGIIENSKKIFTKKSNSEMAFVDLSNENGLTVECIVFPKIFEQYKHLLVKDAVVVMGGRLDTKDDRPHIIVDKISSPFEFLRIDLQQATD
jgi:DNA polymerase-3 subunit alpha